MCDVLTLVIVTVEDVFTVKGRALFVCFSVDCFFGCCLGFFLFGFLCFFVSFNRVTLVRIICLYLLWEGSFEVFAVHLL